MYAYAGALPYGEADKPGEPTLPLFYETLVGLHRDPSVFCVKARRSLRTVFILEQISRNYNTRLYVKPSRRILNSS